MLLRVGALAALFFAISPGLVAQSERPAAPKTDPPRFDPALLNPAALTEQAPDKFEVKFLTTAGSFTISVDRSWAPNEVDRFYNLVKHHYYDGVLFLVSDPEFGAEVSTGPYDPVNSAWQKLKMVRDPRRFSNTPGTIAFTVDGPNRDATNFRINIGNNSAFDQIFDAVFGFVTDGMSVVERLYADYGIEGYDAARSKSTADLKKEYPKLDEIKTTEIEAPSTGRSTADSGAPVRLVSELPPGITIADVLDAPGDMLTIQQILTVRGRGQILTTVKDSTGGPSIQKETNYISILGFVHDCAGSFMNISSSFAAGQLVDETGRISEMSDMGILDPSTISVTKLEGPTDSSTTSEATGFVISVRTRNSAGTIKTTVKSRIAGSSEAQGTSELSFWVSDEDLAKNAAGHLRSAIETCTSKKQSATSNSSN